MKMTINRSTHRCYRTLHQLTRVLSLRLILHTLLLIHRMCHHKTFVLLTHKATANLLMPPATITHHLKEIPMTNMTKEVMKTLITGSSSPFQDMAKTMIGEGHHQVTMIGEDHLQDMTIDVGLHKDTTIGVGHRQDMTIGADHLQDMMIGVDHIQVTTIGVDHHLATTGMTLTTERTAMIQTAMAYLALLITK
jgi:hypothetical protein